MPGAHQVIPVVLALVAAAFFIAGTATCHGTKTSSQVGDFFGGMWKGGDKDCSGPFSYTVSGDCDDITWSGRKDQCQKNNALRAFSVMACIFAGLCLIFLIIQFFQKVGHKMIAVVLFVLAFASGLIAMSIAADMYDKFTVDKGATKLDAGFACLVIGWVVSLIGAIHMQFMGGQQA